MGKVERLVEKMKSDNPNKVLSAICAVTMQAAKPKNIEALVAAGADEDAQVRSFIAELLGYVDDPRVISKLTKLLNDPERPVRRSAACALGNQKSAEAVEPLIQYASSGAYTDVQIKVVNALSNIGDVRAVEPLCDIVANRKACSPEVRSAAADALGELRDESAKESLIYALGDDDRDTREHAALALKALGEPKWAEVMNQRTLSGHVASRTFRDLGRLHDPRALAPIGRILESNPNSEIRTRAAEGLIGFKDPNALPILNKALSDNCNLVQKNAETALSYFKG
jgi:HEAT repeat protein